MNSRPASQTVTDVGQDTSWVSASPAGAGIGDLFIAFIAAIRINGPHGGQRMSSMTTP